MSKLVRIINYTETHSMGVVETRKGNEYASVFAKEFDEQGNTTYPTKEDVKEAWRSNKRFFQSYNSFHR